VWRRWIPNAITVGRLALLPAFAWLVVRGDRDAAIGTLAVIAGSDVLDGYLARRWNVTGRLGAILDPAADKLVQLTGLFLLAALGAPEFTPVPAWFAALVLARELFLVYGTLRIRQQKRSVAVVARFEGKLSTLLVFALLFAALGRVPPAVIHVLCGIATPVVLAAAVRYAREGKAQVDPPPPAADED